MTRVTRMGGLRTLTSKYGLVLCIQFSLSLYITSGQHWEAPPPPQQGSAPEEHFDEDDDEAASNNGEDAPTGDGREAIEQALRERIIVDRFPLASAGQPIAMHEMGSRYDSAQYNSQVRGTPNNPYAPFNSKLDWEVARWAKLRSPSSTAMTELLEIEGVCLCYLCMLV